MWANKEKKQRYRAYYKNTQISFKETQSRGGRGNLEHSSPPKRIMMIMTGCHFSPSQTKVTKLMTQKCRMTVIPEKHGHIIPFVYTNLNSIFES